MSEKEWFEAGTPKARELYAKLRPLCSGYRAEEVRIAIRTLQNALDTEARLDPVSGKAPFRAESPALPDA